MGEEGFLIREKKQTGTNGRVVGHGYDTSMVIVALLLRGVNL